MNHGKQFLNDACMNKVSAGTEDETFMFASHNNSHGGSISYGRRMVQEINDWLKALSPFVSVN